MDVSSTLHLTTRTLDSTVNNQRYFPFIDTVSTIEYEVGGTLNGLAVRTTVNRNLSPDNYGNFLQTSTTITDDDSTSPYYGQVWSYTNSFTITADTSSNWCLGLPTEVDVTHVASSDPALSGAQQTIVRRTALTPDYGKCRITAKTTEPSSAAYKVSETYTFDSFGNITDQSVAGIGMAARTTHLTYDGD